MISTCGAMCIDENLVDILEYIAPIKLNSDLESKDQRPESKVMTAEANSVPVTQSSHHQKPSKKNKAKLKVLRAFFSIFMM